jgi:hypothetical protein
MIHGRPAHCFLNGFPLRLRSGGVNGGSTGEPAQAQSPLADCEENSRRTARKKDLWRTRLKWSSTGFFHRKRYGANARIARNLLRSAFAERFTCGKVPAEVDLTIKASVIPDNNQRL